MQPERPPRRPQGEVPRHRSSRKDTVRWCLGHVGREHVWRYVPQEHWCRNTGYPRELVQLCVNCKKQSNKQFGHGKPGHVARWRQEAVFVDPKTGRCFLSDFGRAVVKEHYYGPGLPPSRLLGDAPE